MDRRTVLALLACAPAMLTVCPVHAFEDVPLPKELNIVPPDGSIPREVAAFSGKWEGRWSGGRATVLVVQRIKPANAKGQHEADVIYAWGSHSTDRPGLREFDATITDRELTIRRANLNIVFRLADNSQTLEGRWQTQGGYSLATLARSAE